MIIYYWKIHFTMTPYVRLLVGWMVGLSVGPKFCHNFLKEREVTLSCFYLSTCLGGKRLYGLPCPSVRR